MYKYCIVNGDDFGASHGINRGIFEAHHHGILTSTSFMVEMPASLEAARFSRESPEMSVGLHVTLTSEEGAPLIDFDSPNNCRYELERQWDYFLDLMGQPPTHLDAHHNIHRDHRLLPVFLEFAQYQSLPLREHSPVKYFSNFYGQWDGETHPEQISVDQLRKMLHDEVGVGFTEIGCHPGYVDSGFLSTYSCEREMELQTLCDPKIRRFGAELEIEFVNYHDVQSMLTDKGYFQEVSD